MGRLSRRALHPGEPRECRLKGDVPERGPEASRREGGSAGTRSSCQTLDKDHRNDRRRTEADLTLLSGSWRGSAAHSCSLGQITADERRDRRRQGRQRQIWQQKPEVPAQRDDARGSRCRV